MSGSFMDYGMPRATDMPSFEMETNEVPTKTNPLGVKGAGEAGTVGALARGDERDQRRARPDRRRLTCRCRARRCGLGALQAAKTRQAAE